MAQKCFKGQGHHRNVKLKSHHDAAHLHPLANVNTKYQLPTPWFPRYSLDKILKSRSLQQGQTILTP